MEKLPTTGVLSDENKTSDLDKAAVTGSARIGIIGADNSGKSVLLAAILAAQKQNIVIVQKKAADITVNGVGYYQVSKRQSSDKVGRMITMLSAFSMFADAGMYGGRKTDILAGINIIKEFELIEQKKSNQPKKVRDAVIYAFNRHFQRVD
ncbi:MAG TPA: hypothetical protein VK528_11990 [Flavobacterium sp.]|nr:hypothetical protein [Flavobacterium sp.]